MCSEISFCLLQRTFLQIFDFYFVRHSVHFKTQIASTNRIRDRWLTECRKQKQCSSWFFSIRVQTNRLGVNETMRYRCKGQTAKIKNQLPMWRPPVLIRNIRNGKASVRCAVCARAMGATTHVCECECEYIYVEIVRNTPHKLKGYLHFMIIIRWSVCSSRADFCSFYSNIVSIWTISLWSS